MIFHEILIIFQCVINVGIFNISNKNMDLYCFLHHKVLQFQVLTFNFGINDDNQHLLELLATNPYFFHRMLTV